MAPKTKQNTKASKNVEHRIMTRSKTIAKNSNKNSLKTVSTDMLISTLTKPLKIVLKRDENFNIERKKQDDLNVRTKSKPSKMQLVTHHEFVEGEIIWARMRGFPLWPAKIIDFPEERNMVNLVFYGDRTRAKMFKTTLTTFKEGAKKFKPGNRMLLNKAVKEALYELAGKV